MYITFNSFFSFKKALNGFDSLNARYDNGFSIINHCHLWPNDIGYNNMTIKTSCKLCCLISAKIYSLMCETYCKSSYPVIVSSIKIFSLMFQHFLKKGGTSLCKNILIIWYHNLGSMSVTKNHEIPTYPAATRSIDVVLWMDN